MLRTFVGVNPTWVIVSHEPSIELCCAPGYSYLDSQLKQIDNDMQQATKNILINELEAYL